MTVHELDSLPYDEKNYPLWFSQRYLEFQQSTGYRSFVVADENGTCVPISVQRRYGFNRGRFLYKPYHVSKPLSGEEEKEFLNRLRSFLRKGKIADVLLPPQHYSVFSGLPDVGWAVPLGIIVLSLENKSEQEIFSRFHPNYRNLIRQAERDKVVAELGMNHYDDFYALYNSTHTRENIRADSYDFIKTLAAYLGDDRVQCGVAYVNGKPDAAIFIIYNSSEAYYMYGGTASVCAHSGSSRLLQWAVIKQLLGKNVKRYCLGGARMGKIEGTKYQRIIEFKTRFGATIEKGYHIIMPVTAKYRIYQPLMRLYLWSKGIREQNETMPFRKLTKSS